MAADGFREIKVVHRTSTEEQAWIVDIDPTAPMAQLLVDLHDALNLTGAPDDYDLRTEGSIDEPVLVITGKTRRTVGNVRPAPPT